MILIKDHIIFYFVVYFDYFFSKSILNVLHKIQFKQSFIITLMLHFYEPNDLFIVFLQLFNYIFKI